jgi:hypothetical protein
VSRGYTEDGESVYGDSLVSGVQLLSVAFRPRLESKLKPISVQDFTVESFRGLSEYTMSVFHLFSFICDHYGKQGVRVGLEQLL